MFEVFITLAFVALTICLFVLSYRLRKMKRQLFELDEKTEFLLDAHRKSIYNERSKKRLKKRVSEMLDQN